MSCQQLLSGPNGGVQAVQTSFLGYIPARLQGVVVGFNKPLRKAPSFPCIKCQKKDDEEYEEITVERYPYHSYYDSSSGQWEPASGARSSIPGPEYWPEGTANQVRAARAPKPTGESEGSPSFGKRPGSRRKKYKTSAASESSESSVADSSEPSKLSVDYPESSGINLAAPEVSEMNIKSGEQVGHEFSSGINVAAPEVSETSVESSEQVGNEFADNTGEVPKDILSEYVIYQQETEEQLSEYELDKKIGRPHPFIDPAKRKPIENKRPNDELWWQWRKPEKEFWSRWQRRRPDSETVFLKAMAETGQIKLFGEHPTLTESALYRARRHAFKEERLQAERERLAEIGPMAYYSEWVKAWKRDTSLEAVQKHFEETGEDENAQLLEMFSYQTAKEYGVMMGTDVRIRRDPLAMRMRDDQIKQIWGGDPVYPTINYIQDPNEVIDYRGPNFHEPIPHPVDLLMEEGKIISKEEMDRILAKEKKPKEVEAEDTEDLTASAIDIGEKEDDSDDDSDADIDIDTVAKTEVSTVVDSDTDSDADTDTKDKTEADADAEADTGTKSEEEDEKLTDGWSILKSTPQLRKSKDKAQKPKKGPMSLEEAVEDAENLTDFLLDFGDDEEEA